MSNRKKICAGGLVLLFICTTAFKLSEAEQPEGKGRAGKRGAESAWNRGRPADESAERRLRDVERRRTAISEQMRQERNEMRSIAGKYADAATEAEKEAIKKELRVLLENGFDKRINALRKRLDALKDECDRIETLIGDMSANKNKIIDKRLEALLGGASRGNEEGRGERRERHKKR